MSCIELCGLLFLFSMFLFERTQIIGLHSHIFSRSSESICTTLLVEAKLHGESKVIQSCFDDNNDDNKRWWQKSQRSIKEQLKWIKNNSRFQDKNQEEFKTQEESLVTRIKIQESSFKNQDQDLRLKIQESREDSIKISIKKFF